MPRIQAFKGSNLLANNRRSKEYYKHFVIIPQALIKALGWKKGDGLEFKLENGKVVLKNLGVRGQ